MATKTSFETASKSQKKSRSGHYVPPRRSLTGRFILWLGRLIARRKLLVEVSGLEHLPSEAPYVLAANHVSYVDGLWILNALPRKMLPLTCVMVGADMPSDYGLVGKAATLAARAILVERKGNPVRGLIIAKNAMLAGNNVLIHPEGTRSHDGRLGDIHSGAAYLAAKTGRPLIPVYLNGAYEIWPRSQKFPSFKDEQGQKRRLELIFGEDLNADQNPEREALNERLKAWLKEMQAQKLDG